jgi:hypothetical protein
MASISMRFQLYSRGTHQPQQQPQIQQQPSTPPQLINKNSFLNPKSGPRLQFNKPQKSGGCASCGGYK